jgi:hypothetical protein
LHATLAINRVTGKSRTSVASNTGKIDGILADLRCAGHKEVLQAKCINGELLLPCPVLIQTLNAALHYL